MKDDDMVIAALRFGREKLENGEFVQAGDLNNHLLERGLLPRSSSDVSAVIDGLHKQIFTQAAEGNRGYAWHMMGLDSYMSLVQYEDLQQARKDSAIARKEAHTALRWAK